MATPGAEFVTLRRKAPETRLPGTVEAELRELEKEITGKRDRPASALLKEVVERVNAITGGDGAAIAVRDPSGVICRASVGDAPQEGSRLQPDSALTRECFETGQVVICEDTDTDYRVRRSTAKSLGLPFCRGCAPEGRGRRFRACSRFYLPGLPHSTQPMLMVCSGYGNAARPSSSMRHRSSLNRQNLSHPSPSHPGKRFSICARTLRQANEGIPRKPSLLCVSTLVPPENQSQAWISSSWLEQRLLMLLLALYFAVLHKPTEPSATAVAPASAPENAAAQSPGAQPAPQESQPLILNAHLS